VIFASGVLVKVSFCKALQNGFHHALDGDFGNNDEAGFRKAALPALEGERHILAQPDRIKETDWNHSPSRQAHGSGAEPSLHFSLERSPVVELAFENQLLTPFLESCVFRSYVRAAAQA
jgi:hypothetical protein